MNIYSYIKLNRGLKNHRIKFMGLWLLHTFKQRYLAIHFDPVMACNLRCKMCYFTDKEYVKKIKGVFKEEDLDRMAKVLFKRAIKLQIGCGTEPTLYKNLPKIVKLAKKNNIPYISLTTNANLLTKERVNDLVTSGLNEFTISLHGVYKEEYENFMGKASYQKFHQALQYIYESKSINPNLKLRINYTFNKDNFTSLQHFFTEYGKYKIDYLQLRPMKSMGDTEYNNTDISSLANIYDTQMQSILQESKQHNTQLIANLQYKKLKSEVNTASFIRPYTYCYISPKYFWKEDFNWKIESFESFSKKIKWGKNILSQAFKSKKEMLKQESKTSLNYDVV